MGGRKKRKERTKKIRKDIEVCTAPSLPRIKEARPHHSTSRSLAGADRQCTLLLFNCISVRAIRKPRLLQLLPEYNKNILREGWRGLEPLHANRVHALAQSMVVTFLLARRASGLSMYSDIRNCGVPLRFIL